MNKKTEDKISLVWTIIVLILIVNFWSIIVSSFSLNNSQPYYVVRNDGRVWKINWEPARSLLGGIWFKNIDNHVCHTSLFHSKVLTQSEWDSTKYRETEPPYSEKSRHFTTEFIWEL